MSDTEQSGEGGAGRTPPYIAYKTFLTFLEDLKAHGIPDQIDRSVLKRFAGGIASQLIMGIKSLGLITADNKPTPRLAELVNTLGTEDFKEPMRSTLREAYPYAFRLDLMTATPSMFAEAFKSNTGAKGEDVLAKCRRFFLQAAAASDIEVGKRLATGGASRTTNGSGTRRKRVRKEEVAAAAPPNPPPPHQPAAMSDKALEYKLVDLMKEDDIDDAERGAIWTLIQYLTKKAKNKAASNES